MKEDFLHYLWRYQKFSFPPLETVCGKAFTVVAVGHPNTASGPDFLEAQITIGALRFVGAVEIHLHSSHWYQHSHQTDKAYDSVILHVVWQHDVPVFLPSGGTLPTLELSRYAHPKLIDFYTRHFLNQKKALPCVAFLSDELLSKWAHWRERVYLERLETRLVAIQERLAQLENNWEALLFERMARSFGLKRNGATFEAMAQSIPYSVIRKIQANPVDLEALFLGHCGLLTEAHDPIPYSKNLRERYRYLCQKFQLSPPIGLGVQFGGLRPYNFPTIRLSQLAQLMHHFPALLEQLYQSKQLSGLDLLRTVGVSEFWKTHFSFSTTSPQNKWFEIRSSASHSERWCLSIR